MEAVHSAEDVKKHVRIYISVFVALLALTMITVTVSYLHLQTVAAITVAITIAAIKGSLVACYFMHLLTERKLIYAVLIITVLFFAVLMSLPLFSHADPIVYHSVS